MKVNEIIITEGPTWDAVKAAGKSLGTGIGKAAAGIGNIPGAVQGAGKSLGTGIGKAAAGIGNISGAVQGAARGAKDIYGAASARAATDAQKHVGRAGGATYPAKKAQPAGAAAAPNDLEQAGAAAGKSQEDALKQRNAITWQQFNKDLTTYKASHAGQFPDTDNFNDYLVRWTDDYMKGPSNIPALKNPNITNPADSSAIYNYIAKRYAETKSKSPAAPAAPASPASPASPAAPAAAPTYSEPITWINGEKYVKSSSHGWVNAADKRTPPPPADVAKLDRVLQKSFAPAQQKV